MAAKTQHRPSDALAGRRFGSFAGKPAFSESLHPVGVLTQHRPDAAIGGRRYGSFAGRAGVSVPTITSVTAVSGTELSVAWTGTATEYRLNSGAATALPDGTSPDTISGLTPNTFYTVELRDGAGAWSTGVGEWTDNTGGGGGGLFEVADAAHAHATDNLALSLGYALTVQDATHGQAAESVGLSTTGEASLSVNSATHAHAADGLDLDLAASLQIADAAHGHTAEGLALTTAAWLAAANAAHGHTADAVALSLSSSDLTVQGATHGHSAGNVGLYFDSDADEGPSVTGYYRRNARKIISGQARSDGAEVMLAIAARRRR